MDLAYGHGGSTSFKRDSRLAECWRDLHTAGQTVTLTPEWYPIVISASSPAAPCAKPARQEWPSDRPLSYSAATGVGHGYCGNR
jgi:hypothetical protein